MQWRDNTDRGRSYGEGEDEREAYIEGKTTLIASWGEVEAGTDI